MSVTKSGFYRSNDNVDITFSFVFSDSFATRFSGKNIYLLKNSSTNYNCTFAYNLGDVATSTSGLQAIYSGYANNVTIGFLRSDLTSQDRQDLLAYTKVDSAKINTLVNYDYIPLKLPSFGFNSISVDYEDNSTPKATFNNILNHCSIDNIKTQYESETDFICTISADEHYYFDDKPKIRYVKNAVTTEIEFDKINDCEYSIIFNDTVSDGTDIQIIATGFETYANVIDNTENVETFYHSDTVFEKNFPTLFSVKKSSANYFSLAELTYLDFDGILTTVEGVIDSDNPDWIRFRLGADVRIYPKSNIQVNVRCSVQSRCIRSVLQNCVMQPALTEYELNSDVVLTFTPNEDCIFNSTPVLGYYNNGNFRMIEGVSNEEAYTITFKIPKIDDDTDIEVYATAILKTSKVYNIFGGAVNVYKLNEDNLKTIAQTRFKVLENDTGIDTNQSNTNIISYLESIKYTAVDLADYITSLKRFFINVEATGISNIQLGNATLATVANTIDSIFVTIDLGHNFINGFYGTQNDYYDSELIANLPYCGIHKLNSRFVNRDIKIEYKINIVNGNCVVNFTDNETGELLDSVKAHICIDVPYQTLRQKSDFSNDVHNVNFTESNLYDDIEPCIIIRSKLPIEGDIGKCDFNIALSELDGYAVIDLCNVTNINATLKELELIESVLKNGVLFEKKQTQQGE